jgi:parallel beta helix pectate lyase-like protein
MRRPSHRLALTGATAVAVLSVIGAVAVSGFSFGSRRPAPAGWAPRAWPPVAAAGRDAGCDRMASPRGSDRNRGTPAAPVRTAQALARVLRPGETGCLRGGTYEGRPYVLSLRHPGRRGAPITIRNYPGERARLLGITQIRPTARWIVLSGLYFEGDGSQNTIKIYGSDIIVERSDITNRRRGLSCVLLGSVEEGAAVRPVLRRNHLHDCGDPAHGNKDHGIYAAYTAGGRISRNYFADSSGYAIQFYPNAQHTRFDHNVVDGDGDSIRGGIVFGGAFGHASSDNLVEHNVIAYAATYGVTANWEGPRGSGNVVRDNCFWGSREADVDRPFGFSASANVVADPEFRDRARGDLRMPRNRCRQVLG